MIESTLSEPFSRACISMQLKGKKKKRRKKGKKKVPAAV